MFVDREVAVVEIVGAAEVVGVAVFLLPHPASTKAAPEAIRSRDLARIPDMLGACA
jgi:hypothetical protein